jgi:hypothetical protein
MQAQRLANSSSRQYAPNIEFGKVNEERQEAVLAGFANKLLSSTPFCWLLKDDLDASSEKSQTRREGLIDVFRKAGQTMIRCETWTNGQPVLRGINELNGVFRGYSDCITLHPYCWRPQMDLYTNQDILVVPRPGLVYVDSVNGVRASISRKAIEVIDAEVIPRYIEETGLAMEGQMDTAEDQAEDEAGDDAEDTESDGKPADDDEDWVEEESD